MNRRPKLTIIAPDASPDEAAAVVAALEQFMRDTAPPPAAAEERHNPWMRRALLDGLRGATENPTPWGDPHPWG